jgi:fatty-acyl-CoA synthase
MTPHAPSTAPATVVQALARLPKDGERGFRFRALDGQEHSYPWRALELEATRRAQLLFDLGLRKGDRAALVLAEPHEFVLTFLGAVMAGVVAVPIYPRASFKAKNAYVETVKHIVEASGARVLITLASTRPVIDELLAAGTALEQIVVLEELIGRVPGGAARSTALPAIEPDDLCFLQFTSGSTSLPKGVMVTHRTLVANALAFLGPHGAKRLPDDVALTWLPLFHDMGLIGFVLGTMMTDVPTVLLPTEAFARRPTMWMQAMHDYRATITFAPNFAYALATKRCRDKDLEGLDLRCVRVAGCGAEPISADVMRAFLARFAPAGFSRDALLPGYGMAEATLAITFHPQGTPLVTDRVDAERMRAGEAVPATPGREALELVSCGVPFPEHEVSIVSPEGAMLPERAVGEITVAGPSVTAGYFENPTATGETFRGGRLHTGDLGYIAGGNLYVCGRIKDLIIIRGANFYPQDIEWAVAEVPGVRRDNVVAFSTSKGGDEQLIIAAEGNSTDASELQKTIATRVVEACGVAPSRVCVVRVGSLPKTSSGKIQRRRTRELYERDLLELHPE